MVAAMAPPDPALGKRKARRFWLAAAAPALITLAPSPVFAECAGILATHEGDQFEGGRISPLELVRLRDIGSNLGRPDETIPSLSPDGRWAAMVISRADPDTNQYCLALVKVPLAGGNPQVLDQSGDAIFDPVDLRGLRTDYGYPKAIVPQWSPDGRWIAWLKRRDGTTRVWKARADGTGARAATPASIDVDAFGWASDGGSLLIASRPGIAEAEKAIEQEGHQGFLYDDRFLPSLAGRPLVTLPIAYIFHAVDLATGAIRPASREERQQLELPPAPGTEAPELDALRQALRPTLRRALGHGDERAIGECSTDACVDTWIRSISHIWALGRETFLILRREGWGNSQQALYRLDAAPRLRSLLRTDDLIGGCSPGASELICTWERSLRPRHLMAVDIDTGALRPIFDPNPAFSSNQPPTKVERLKWRTDGGAECYGDLVLPPNYKAGQRVPLIVVQYRTRGFLRGGTGDEYPILAFAARGYAVLSVERPAVEMARSSPPPIDGTSSIGPDPWAERREVTSALVNGVRLVIARGVADPGRVGITGLSDGATTARFALLNTNMFAAASLSSCCFEARPMMVYGGPRVAADRRRGGFPAAEDDAAWRQQSLTLNADRLRTPILMQLADSEYIFALETHAALRAQGKPIEIYVFPKEYHLKWQPAHRLAIYNRNLQWFDYWLRGIRWGNADPTQYDRWDQLRHEANP